MSQAIGQGNAAAGPCEDYLAGLTDCVTRTLGASLVGLYLHGSAVQQDFDPVRSDVDVLGVVTQPPSDPQRAALAAGLAHDARPVPGSGLDFILCSREAVAAPSHNYRFEFAVSTGEGLPTEMEGPGIAGEILIHAALCRSSGRALHGPPPEQVFAPVPRSLLCEGLLVEMEWHLGELARAPTEVAIRNAVLNAARSQFAAETGQILSKSRGARRWLEAHPQDVFVERAAAHRMGLGDHGIAADRAAAFVRQVSDRIRQLMV